MGSLVTGGTGFIGGVLLDRLIESGRGDIVLLARPGTASSRYTRFQQAGVHVESVTMHDQQAIRRLFDTHNFDVVYHVAAIRGAQAPPWERYHAVNVQAVEYIAREASRQQCRLVYCSSVGIFGTIPQTLPANESTVRRGDNYYHRSKVLAEELLSRMVAEGLDVVTLRPTITYGANDYGFPYSLVRLVDRGLFVHCGRDLRIHMGDVHVLAEAFLLAAEASVPSGSSYIVGDREPVRLLDLVDLVHKRLKRRPYPRWKRLPGPAFDLASWVCGTVLRSESWKVRFELISQSWCYDVEPARRDLGLDMAQTMERFGYVVDWYLDTKRGPWQ